MYVNVKIFVFIDYRKTIASIYVFFSKYMAKICSFLRFIDGGSETDSNGNHHIFASILI